MGECFIKPRNLPDFGERDWILYVGPNEPDVATKDEADPGSIINGGPGVPVVKPEGRK